MSRRAIIHPGFRPFGPIGTMPRFRQEIHGMRPTDDELDRLLAPRCPNDPMPFSALAAQYNFRLTSDRRRVFSRLVIDECDAREKPVRALDVGCGRGIGRQTPYTWAIRRALDEFWGIEPDGDVTPEDRLFDHFEHADIQTAALPPAYFDLIYCYMVMEHVAEPASFLTRVHECLKPGG